MSTPKTPKPPTPQEAAQAAIATQGAGEMMGIANQPVEQYGTLLTQSKLGPAQTQLNSALQNQAALRSAQAQFDIQSKVDPQAYASRQMRMNAANARLGQLTGQDPNSFKYSAPEAYQTPTTSDLGSIGDLGEMARRLAMNVSTGYVNNNKPGLTWGQAREVTG